MRNSKSVAAICIIGLGATMNALAAEGEFLVRVRATYLDFDNGQNGMPAEVLADSRWIPEVDISYFLTDKLSTELVLTWPQKVDISVDGADAGSVNALPPTLLAQYHFPNLGKLQPYAGAGLNLTLFSKRALLGGAARTDKSSVGYALQIGADVPLNGRWSLNADLKYIDMDTGVHVTDTRIGTLDLNPWVASVGFGYTLR
jgi:outer membrane protein